MEEEWDNNELELVPHYDATEEVDFGDNICFNSDDLQQVCTSNSNFLVLSLHLDFNLSA